MACLRGTAGDRHGFRDSCISNAMKRGGKVSKPSAESMVGKPLAKPSSGATPRRGRAFRSSSASKGMDPSSDALRREAADWFARYRDGVLAP